MTMLSNDAQGSCNKWENNRGLQDSSIASLTKQIAALHAHTPYNQLTISEQMP